MKRLQFNPGEEEETTWAGCLLVLGTALAALLFTVWVAPLYAVPLLGLLDENSFDLVKLVVGVILYSPTVLVGLGFFFGIGALLQLVGICLFRKRRRR